MKKHIVFKKKEQISLTPMEYDLLCTLAKNRNIALEREKLLNAIWGNRFRGRDENCRCACGGITQENRTSYSSCAKDWISSGGRRMKLRSRITIGTLGFC